MEIKKYAPMIRQGSDLNKVTSLLINGRLDGVNNEILKKLPGYSIETQNLNIDGGGTVDFYRGITFFKNKSNETLMIGLGLDGYLYYRKDGDWIKIDYDTTDPILIVHNYILYWFDRGTLHIGTGASESTPLVYEYIDRQIADNNGYFNNSEEYEGYIITKEEFPQFNSDNIGYCLMIPSNFRYQDWGGGLSLVTTESVDDPLLKPTEAYLMFGQFVYQGGQVSIPTNDGSVMRGISHGWDCFMQTKIYIDKDDYDKRLEGIDIYVSKLSNESGYFNLVNYPGMWGEGKAVATKTVAEEVYATRNWKFLQRLNVKKDSVIWSGIASYDSTIDAFQITSSYFDDNTGLTANHFPKGFFGGKKYILKWASMDDPNNWTEVTITYNNTYASNLLYNHSMTNIQVDDTSGLIDGDKYYIRIISKWEEETNPKAEAIIFIHGDSLGQKVTLESTSLSINETFTIVGADIDAQAQSLASLINASSNFYAWTVNTLTSGVHYGIDYRYVYVKYDGGSETGNSIQISTDASLSQIILSDSYLRGGKNGTFYSTHVGWRFDPELAIDVGDPIDVAQPYKLIEEYYPSFQFATSQDRRVFRLDCFLDKRYRNMLMWSEIDMPAVIPNLNNILLNTFPDEQSRGLLAINNGLLALFERSGHLIRMTGEPIQYDAEESKFDVGCIGAGTALEIGGIAFWLGYDGIYIFTDQYKNLIEDIFLDDYISLIANEYANEGHYQDIQSGYSPEDKLIIWTFPHSTYTIEGYDIKLLAWDLRKQELIILESNKTFLDFATGYDGKLYGRASDGFYKLFASSPSESNRLIYRSGKMYMPGGRLTSSQIKIRYLGTMKVKLINDLDNTVLEENFGENTSMNFRIRDIASEGEEIEIEILSNAKNTDDEKIGNIYLEQGQINE